MGRKRREVGPKDLPLEARRQVGVAWAHRARSEREAALRFTGLAPRLEALGVPALLVTLARNAATDERNHARLCDRVASAYGTAALPERAMPHVAPPDLPEALGTAYAVVAQCCLTETFNVAYLTAVLDVARADLVRKTVRRLLRDEVQHSRLGWGFVATDAGRRAAPELAALVPRMLDATVGDELFADPAGDAGVPDHGELPRARRHAVFADVMGEAILPGLRSASIATEPAERWLAER